MTKTKFESYEEFRNYVLREDLTEKQQENAWTTVDIDFVHQWFKDPRNKVTAEEKMAYYGERNRNRNELNRITNNKSKIQPRVF